MLGASDRLCFSSYRLSASLQCFARLTQSIEATPLCQPRHAFDSSASFACDRNQTRQGVRSASKYSRLGGCPDPKQQRNNQHNEPARRSRSAKLLNSVLQWLGFVRRALASTADQTLGLRSARPGCPVGNSVTWYFLRVTQSLPFCNSQFILSSRSRLSFHRRTRLPDSSKGRAKVQGHDPHLSHKALAAQLFVRLLLTSLHSLCQMKAGDGAMVTGCATEPEAQTSRHALARRMKRHGPTG